MKRSAEPSMSLAPASTGSVGLLNRRQWWRVCLVHGDQTKYYRQLYGHKRAAIRTQLQNDTKKIASAVDAAAAGASAGGSGQCTATQTDIAAG